MITFSCSGVNSKEFTNLCIGDIIMIANIAAQYADADIKNKRIKIAMPEQIRSDIISQFYKLEQTKSS